MRAKLEEALLPPIVALLIALIVGDVLAQDEPALRRRVG